ncbi:hypothetical protein Q8A73_002567 [Channa argus]|nr:hypothetical protein Q8A73_002567 [Channa argus]
MDEEEKEDVYRKRHSQLVPFCFMCGDDLVSVHTLGQNVAAVVTKANWHDAIGHLQCSAGLYVLFKGSAGENFGSNTAILQLPAHSQRTPLSAAGIDPTTFRLLVSLHIQGSLGRGGTLPWAGQINTLAGERAMEAVKRVFATNLPTKSEMIPSRARRTIISSWYVLMSALFREPLRGLDTTAVWQWSDISCSDILSQFISPASGWTEALEGHTSTSNANLSFCQHHPMAESDSCPRLHVFAVNSGPLPSLPGCGYPPFSAVPSPPRSPPSPESPTIFTRFGRALTFLNEKPLFAAPQQLTIYDKEASLESQLLALVGPVEGPHHHQCVCHLPAVIYDSPIRQKEEKTGRTIACGAHRPLLFFLLPLLFSLISSLSESEPPKQNAFQIPSPLRSALPLPECSAARQTAHLLSRDSVASPTFRLQFDVLLYSALYLCPAFIEEERTGRRRNPPDLLVYQQPGE